MRQSLNLAIQSRAQLRSTANQITEEYQAVLNAMTVKPPDVDKINQNAILKAFKDKNYLPRIEMFTLFATHDSQSALINWKSPGYKNPTKKNAPVFTPYQGFKGVSATASCIDLNFSPATEALVMSQDNGSIIVGIGDNIDDASGVDFGSTRMRINSRNSGTSTTENSLSGYTAFGVYSLSSKRHIATTRNNGTTINVFCNNSKNLGQHVTNTVSSGLGTAMYACAFGYSGVASSYNKRHLRYYLLGAYFTEDEVIDIMSIFETYLKTVGTPIITSPLINLAIEGHSFTTQHPSFSRLREMIANNVPCIKNKGNGVDGSTIAGMVTRSATLNAMLSTTHQNYLVLWIGTNDFNANAGTGTTAYNALKAAVNNYKIAGWNKILVYTCTPKTSLPDSTERVVFNNNVRDDLSTIEGVYILNTDAIAELNDPSNTTYFSDGVHLQQSGDKLAAALAINKINELNV